MFRKTRPLIAAALVATAVAGCGGDDEETGPAASSTPAGEAEAPRQVDATMRDFQFDPQEITVAAGGKVTWTDEDSANHNVRFDGDDAPEGIDNLSSGESRSVTFKDPGTFAFVCTYHPNMKGTVTVR